MRRGTLGVDKTKWVHMLEDAARYAPEKLGGRPAPVRRLWLDRCQRHQHGLRLAWQNLDPARRGLHHRVRKGISRYVLDLLLAENTSFVCLKDCLVLDVIRRSECGLWLVRTLEDSGLHSQVKIMVGGAPITQAFCDEIGADVYTEDAASAGQAAKKLALERGA